MAVASNNLIPPQGTPGVADGRNPTLLPNFDKPVSGSLQSGGNASPAAYLTDHPRVDATVTATFGGSAASGDELTIEYTNPVLQALTPPKLSVTITVGGSDTLNSIAEAFATGFNDLATAQSIDLRADAALAVLTLRQPGPVGNFGVATKPIQEPVTVTMGGTSHTGDRASVLFTGPGLGNGVLIQTNPTTTQTATQMGDDLVTAIAANSVLAGLSIVGVNTSGAVALTMPAGDYNVTSWVNTITPTATVAGSIGTGDTATLTFTGAGITGSPVSVVYTALLGDTATRVAAGLVALIAANTALQTAGITATNLAGVITFAYPQAVGQLRYARTVTGGVTVALTAAPTTTAVTSTTSSTTITLGNSGKMAGGSGPVIAANNFNFAYQGQAQSFFYGQPYILDFPYITALVNSGEPIV